MTASTPPLVDVIAEAVAKALDLDIDGEREDQAFWYNSAPSEWPAVIARAVLDALTEAQAVAWDEGALAAWERSTPMVNGTHYKWRHKGEPLNPYRGAIQQALDG